MRPRHEDGFWGRLLCKTFPRNKPGSILTTESPEKEPVMRMHASFLVAVTVVMGAGVAGAQPWAPRARAPPPRAAAAPAGRSPAGHSGGTAVKPGEGPNAEEHADGGRTVPGEA